MPPHRQYLHQGRVPAARADLRTLLADHARIDAAVAAAQADAVRTHALLGRPVVVWRDGRVVELLVALPAGRTLRVTGGR